MEYYPDLTTDTVFDQLDVTVRALDAAAALSTALQHPMLLPNTHGYDKPRPNQKYVRVWAQGWSMPYYCPECKAEVRERLRTTKPGESEPVNCDHDKQPEEGQRFVAFFVEVATGDVWKAAGWKAPALNFTRGNITTPEGRAAITLAKITPTGYFYAGF